MASRYPYLGDEWMREYFFKRRIIVKVGRSTINAKLIDAQQGLYELQEDFLYSIRYRGNTYEFNIPAGFFTNFASVPRWAWKFFHPTDNEMLVASCVHDFVLNEFNQDWLPRVVCVDGVEVPICTIDGFTAADLFFFSLSQEGSYNLPVRQFLRMCVKGFYFCTLRGWIPIK